MKQGYRTRWHKFYIALWGSCCVCGPVVSFNMEPNQVPLKLDQIMAQSDRSTSRVSAKPASKYLFCLQLWEQNKTYKTDIIESLISPFDVLPCFAHVRLCQASDLLREVARDPSRPERMRPRQSAQNYGRPPGEFRRESESGGYCIFSNTYTRTI